MPVPDFSPGEVLTAAAMDSIGSWLVKTQDFTTADPLDLTGIFTSNYNFYELYLDYYGSSAAATLNLQFFSGTNTIYTSSNYYRYGFNVSTAGVLTNGQFGPTSSLPLAIASTSATQQTAVKMTFMSPNGSGRKYIFSQFFDPTTGAVWFFNSQVVETTAFTGIRLDASAGTITGKIRIYGMRN